MGGTAIFAVANIYALLIRSCSALSFHLCSFANGQQEELNALDIFHKFFLVARHDALFSAPLNAAHRLRLLDLGTGTGIWAIDMAM